ncbi:ribosomal protein S18-alanine N-acetyltransferase [Synechococcus sp. PCC 7336]|uniref:ribosomal protein S18-alanine N-acetyltransferase n=1 Tax=Synechococcus sp. PCC 7336 TaxID=195250 RepID=UPI00034DE2A0|nr:ribosomal protein S18-alanine N-acetyltransferase [Synechococcus sp. PCC 7336]
MADKTYTDSYCLAAATLEHLDDLVQLDRLCFGGQWTRAGFAAELARPPRDPDRPDRPSSLVLGAWTTEKECRPIGFAALWAMGSEAHIISLGVHPDYRRQGVGRQLIETLLQQAIALGLEWATLEVRESNRAALDLYDSLDFEQVGRRKRYYDNPTEDALILWKRL